MSETLVLNVLDGGQCVVKADDERLGEWPLRGRVDDGRARGQLNGIVANLGTKKIFDPLPSMRPQSATSRYASGQRGPCEAARIVSEARVPSYLLLQLRKEVALQDRLLRLLRADHQRIEEPSEHRSQHSHATPALRQGTSQLEGSRRRCGRVPVVESSEELRQRGAQELWPIDGGVEVRSKQRTHRANRLVKGSRRLKHWM